MKTLYPPERGDQKQGQGPPNVPKRLPSAFLLSCSMYCPKEIKGGPPDLFIGDITKKLGAMWNNIPADDRQPGERKTAKVKGKCEKDIAAYGAKGKPMQRTGGWTRLKIVRKRRKRRMRMRMQRMRKKRKAGMKIGMICLS